MKHILLLLMALWTGIAVMPAPARAQLIREREPLDARYLAGAVPVAGGLVTFSRQIDLPENMTPDRAFDTAKHWIGQYFNRQENEVLSRKTLALDSLNHFVQVGINQYLVFRRNSLVLDRAQFVFSLAVSVSGGKATVTMSDIVYYYGDDSEFTDKSGVEKYDAEGLITDEACLSRKGDRLNRKNGKFRIATIDAFDAIVASLAEALGR